MIVYQQSLAHDALLVQWWAQLHESGEAITLFHSSAYSATGFLSIFQVPAILLFEYDERGLWIAVWFSPMLSGVIMSMWIRKDKRRSKAAMRIVLTCLEDALQRWPVMLAFTKDSAVAKLHTHIGFRGAWEIPKLLDGDTIYLSYITPEMYAAARRR